MRDAREPAERLQGSDVPRDEESAQMLRGAPMSVLFFVADGDEEAAAEEADDLFEPSDSARAHAANDARPIAR